MTLPGPAPRKPRLLVVDDEPDILELIALLLNDCQVVTSGDAEDALKHASQGGFDLVVTDVKLPGVHDIELVAELRRLLPGVPLVAVSGNDAPEGLHSDYFLLKPFRGQELQAVVVRALADFKGRASRS